MSVKKTNDFVLYRLDMIERRLDLVEAQLLKGQTSGNGELIQLLLEMIRGKDLLPAKDASAQNQVQAQPQPQTPPALDNFDISTLMARRRAIV